MARDVKETYNIDISQSIQNISVSQDFMDTLYNKTVVLQTIRKTGLMVKSLPLWHATSAALGRRGALQEQDLMNSTAAKSGSCDFSCAKVASFSSLDLFLYFAYSLSWHYISEQHICNRPISDLKIKRKIRLRKNY